VTKNEDILNKRDFQKLCNEIYATHKTIKPIPNIAFIERYHEMVADARITPSARVEKIFRKRGVRNQSWIAVISLLTKFWWCPGKCIFCPNFEGLPRSYIPDEPAVMRAQMNEFDPIKQVFNRLRGLRITGHCIDKCDVRIIGGTWSVYPKLYQELFIKAIYDAHTLYEELEPFIEATSSGTDKFAEFKIKKGFEMRESKTLEEAKERNMHARSRVVGIQIETRPDWITIEEIKRLRSYDVTRVEIGYQTTIDEINELNKRWHGNKESIEATRMLKDAGFKVCAHMMPNLLGSTPDMDRNSMREVFDNADYRPDELKIYPMMVTDKSELTEIWRKGGFRAYDDETLIPLMADLLEMVPPYVRLNRVYRDIPAHQILHGSHLANLRQVAEELLHSRGGKVVDTASREVKGKEFDIDALRLITREYDASGGRDYLISFEKNSICSGNAASLWKEVPRDEAEDCEKNKSSYKENDKHLPYNIELKEYSQEMRKNPSLAEKRMWFDILKYWELKKYSFNRQKPLLNYIADFYCSELKLVIEVDWDNHEDQKWYDTKRTNELEKYGITVLRFHNLEVINDPAKVEKEILEWIKDSQKHPCERGMPARQGDCEIIDPSNSIRTILWQSSGTSCHLLSQGGFDTIPPEAPNDATLYSLLRLRIPSQYYTGEPHFLPVLKWAAIIREIHTFWEQVAIGEEDESAIQHRWFGKKMVLEAERIVRENYSDITKIAVIAGVGVRPYFEKLWYILEDGYMIKVLKGTY